MQEQTIFDLLYTKYKIDKPIRLIEFFAGYGSQALALKYLGVDFEHWKICEWAVKSIQAYNDLHFQDYKDYSKGLTKENIIDVLHYLGISNNYNEPMKLEQIKRLNEKQLRTIYNNNVATRNLVNIQKVKGSDLEIVDTDKYTYIFTYSFPCQDLSLAGKGKGMSDTSTRSGLLWEVERILSELEHKPQILLMENVPQVHGEDNKPDFLKWITRLEEMGYQNYWQDLIATDYGIPQTRNRCFMISILGDYSYSFPPKQELKLKLKDMLENDVPEKYYLSDKMINYFVYNTQKQKEKGNTFKFDPVEEENANVSKTITTKAGNRMDDNFIQIKNATKRGYLEAEEGDGIDISSRMDTHRGTVQKGKAQTLTTKGGENNGVVVADTLKREMCNKLIQENAVEEGDIIRHSYTTQIMEGKKKCADQNDGNMCTLTTRGDVYGVCVYDFDSSEKFLRNGDRDMGEQDQFPTLLAKGQKYGIYLKNKTEKDSLYSDLEKQLFTEDGNIKRYLGGELVDEFKEGQMATTTYPNGYGHGPRTHNEAISLNTIDRPSVKQNLRIRKLTPRECFRLMGVKDEDFDKVAKNQSDSSLYHLAGDSIVVDVIKYVINELIRK